jgi:HPt (histidine-containing phosphotransfer) domain-containing protein
MKGTGAAYGLPAVGEIGRRLEEAASRRDTGEIHAALDDLETLVGRLVEEQEADAESEGSRDTRSSGLFRRAPAFWGDDVEKEDSQ